ncbi:hypothetical protein JCM10550A_14200 [Methanogenium cariaci]
MGVKRNLQIIVFFLAVVCVLAVSACAGQEYSITDICSPDVSLYGWSASGLYSGPAVPFEGDYTQSSLPNPVPEFPTLAVPAGLLVGMIYILFILKNKGRKNP